MFAKIGTEKDEGLMQAIHRVHRIQLENSGAHQQRPLRPLRLAI